MRQRARRLDDDFARLAVVRLLEAIGVCRIVVAKVADLRGIRQRECDRRTGRNRHRMRKGELADRFDGFRKGIFNRLAALRGEAGYRIDRLEFVAIDLRRSPIDQRVAGLAFQIVGRVLTKIGLHDIGRIADGDPIVTGGIRRAIRSMAGAGSTTASTLFSACRRAASCLINLVKAARSSAGRPR